MEANSKIVKLDPEREILPMTQDINAALLGAYKLIKQNTNGHLVKVTMDTHDNLEGFWNKKVVSQNIEFKVVITVDIKEEHK
jgi:hypothetical protein